MDTLDQERNAKVKMMDNCLDSHVFNYFSLVLRIRCHWINFYLEFSLSAIKGNGANYKNMLFGGNVSPK